MSPMRVVIAGAVIGAGLMLIAWFVVMTAWVVMT